VEGGWSECAGMLPWGGGEDATRMERRKRGRKARGPEGGHGGGGRAAAWPWGGWAFQSSGRVVQLGGKKHWPPANAGERARGLVASKAERAWLEWGAAAPPGRTRRHAVRPRPVGRGGPGPEEAKR